MEKNAENAKNNAENIVSSDAPKILEFSLDTSRVTIPWVKGAKYLLHKFSNNDNEFCKYALQQENTEILEELRTYAREEIRVYFQEYLAKNFNDESQNKKSPNIFLHTTDPWLTTFLGNHSQTISQKNPVITIIQTNNYLDLELLEKVKSFNANLESEKQARKKLEEKIMEEEPKVSKKGTSPAKKLIYSNPISLQDNDNTTSYKQATLYCRKTKKGKHRKKYSSFAEKMGALIEEYEEKLKADKQRHLKNKIKTPPKTAKTAKNETSTGQLKTKPTAKQPLSPPQKPLKINTGLKPERNKPTSTSLTESKGGDPSTPSPTEPDQKETTLTEPSKNSENQNYPVNDTETFDNNSTSSEEPVHYQKTVFTSKNKTDTTNAEESTDQPLQKRNIFQRNPIKISLAAGLLVTLLFAGLATFLFLTVTVTNPIPVIIAVLITVAAGLVTGVMTHTFIVISIGQSSDSNEENFSPKTENTTGANATGAYSLNSSIKEERIVKEEEPKINIKQGSENNSENNNKISGKEPSQSNTK